MSESEVSQIRDEDVLRRMWQQTEDFSRKKEIRSHMYRLREERLRSLYSPEPAPDGKGCEFTSAQGHVQSFADQTFQSMKSKEVRDAGSPPKEFAYRGQDLKELSNAGWNVESEDRTTDDGRTHVKSVNANIEGRYDVEGGRGQFAAVDRQRQAVSEYRDDNSSLRRDETSSDTASHEHVLQQTDDGTRISSTTSSSNTSSKLQQVSSTKRDTVPHVTDADYDLARRNAHDTNRNEQLTKITNSNDNEQTLRRNDFTDSELVSRKVEYPDDNTKVIVETRCLPDGTRVTSTRREFRVPAQSTRSEYQTRSESKSYSSHHKSDTRDSSSKTTRQTVDNRTNDIVDSQRNVDDNDFKRQIREYTVKDSDDFVDTQQRYATKINRKVTDYTQTDEDHSQKSYETKVNSKVIDHSTTNRDDHLQTENQQNYNQVDENDRRQVTTTRDHDIKHKIGTENRHISDTEERIHKITKERKDTEGKTQHILRDRMDIRDIPKDRPVSVEKSRGTPRDGTVPVGRNRDTPRDGIVPVEKFRDIPKVETVPEESGRDIPRNRSVPVETLRDVPRDGTVPVETGRDLPKDITVANKRVNNITRDTKVEEIVERKTSSDHYQTTYQNDYQTQKISTDWSPTHQAWASTLRSDTPPTTRPSTRASSPGSRTSTSSLRSSVSPDKSSQKSSRGGSPYKIDRYSPARTVTSDRYLSTHSTHSVTEVRTNKNTSPERKPPTGRSPTRPGHSPDRKSQDMHSQRPSVSPEKRPQNRPSLSPEQKPHRKSTDKSPRSASPAGKSESPRSPAGLRQSPERRPAHQPSDEHPSNTYHRTSPFRSTSSPERKPTDGHPSRSSPRKSLSPDRKPGYQKLTDSSIAGYPRTTSPSQPNYLTDDAPRKSDTSPDRKPGYQQSRQSPDKPVNKYPTDLTSKRPSVSPDRKPSYMRPTASSQPNDKTRKPNEPEDEPDRQYSVKQAPAQSPDRNPQHFNKTSKIKEDHYRFVDRETKVYTSTEKTDINKTVTNTPTPVADSCHPRDPSPISDIPDEDLPDFCKGPINKGKSLSPQKDKINFTENDELYGRNIKTVETIDIATKHDKQTENITIVKRTPKNTETPTGKDVPSRETSPSKYGTYDKKKPREVVNITEVTTYKDTKDINYDSTRRDKTLPQHLPGVPSSPSKKIPRDSSSPDKSPTKDIKYKHTTEFLATERTTGEITKKTTKEHSRQLVTPSSSPTRKPKTTETEPSTGQSSPTTSVSGFVYFGSPRPEGPIVTDLDEFFPESEKPDEIIKRPESLDVKKSPSPSKIPCRSPSPDKNVPTTNGTLPRKSSLKKPSTDVNQPSPIEKPPTSFRVSPTDDKPDLPETAESKLFEPDSIVKPKPPLKRRETYEDRCKKNLGMVEDTTTESITKETRRYTNKPDSSQSCSPSVSPCDSPVRKESSPAHDYPTIKKTSNTKIDVTEFITHEQDDFTKVMVTHDGKNAKIPPRESSPSKLQDIYTKTTLITDENKKENVKADTITRTGTNKHPSSRPSPVKPSHKPSEEMGYDSPINTFEKRPSKSPERKPSLSSSQPPRPRERSPSRSTLSPERKPVDKYPQEVTPKTSPGKFPGYTFKTITSVNKNETTSTTDKVQEIIKITEKLQPTRILESPTWQIPKSTQDFAENPEYSTATPSRPQPKDESPVRKPASQDRKFESDYPEVSHLNPDNLGYDITRSRPRDSPERTPANKKSTTTTSKSDSIYMTYTTEDFDETCSTRTQERKEPRTKALTSPTRKNPQSIAYTGSPTKSSYPSGNSNKEPDSSPQRMPIRDAPMMKPRGEKPKDSIPTKPHDVPGYMKTTTAATTKFDTRTVSENAQETTKSKTVEIKHGSLGRANSPTRKTSQPKSFPEQRTPSPTKMNRPSDVSPDRKPGRSQQLSSPIEESPAKIPTSKHPTETLTTRPGPENLPGYMKTTASVTSKHDTTQYDSTTTENIQETVTSKTTEKEYPFTRNTELPSRQTPKSTDGSAPEYLHTTELSRTSHTTYDTLKGHGLTPERKPGHQNPSNDTEKLVDKYPKISSPKNPENTIGYIKTIKAVTSNLDTTSTPENIEKNVKKNHPSETPVRGNPKTSDHPRTQSPSKPTDKALRTSTSPDRKTSLKLTKNNSLPENKKPKDFTPARSSVSPERPSYMKSTASMTSKFDTAITSQETQETHNSRIGKAKGTSPRSSVSPGRQSPERENFGYLTKPEEPKQLRTTSPIKKTKKVTEANTDFIMSEREQEILTKVQKSLRKLSPERQERSPSRERSPTKSTTSLQDLDIITKETLHTDNLLKEDLSQIIEEQAITSKITIRPGQLKVDKSNEQKIPNKPSSKNISPTKRAPTSSSNKVDKSPESPTKFRSTSPKKPVSHIERPQSPQVPKASGIKPRDQIPAHLTRKPIPATLSPIKTERVTTEVKKTNGVMKQNVFTKTTTSKTINRSIPSPTSKTSEPESKRTPTSKGIKENFSPKKDAVTRTVSDIAMKPKKTSSPQRMKSKPEIQVSDMSTKSPKFQKPVIKEPHSKLPNKPKSATALNTSTDEDDVIIDVQQSKSSRENSPDRICPTPINISDDVGIPRFPDEVSEPDDDLIKRSYHTIHETESVVDDIVEICEDEELFVKKSDMNVITEYDDSLLSVNDKVNKFTSKIHTVTKPKDITNLFKDTEGRVHSDFVEENLKSDECLLTVLEKVNKFAKGPRNTKDSRSPSRKITDEYDRDTVYQDDYTKLSVNDKAHLFVETAENVKVTKVKKAQKMERPDLSHVDESLKSDDCLLSVSDKVSKFVKSAEQYLTETQVVEETENKIKEKHEKIMKQIVEDDYESYDTKEEKKTTYIDTTDEISISHPTDKSKPRTKEPKLSQPRQNYISPNAKPVDRVPAVKITTLRSSEAVKKAKALFENIASAQKTTQNDTTHTAKTTKLTDIGVIKKSPKTDSTTVLHPSVEDVSPQVTDVDSEVDIVPSNKDRPSSKTPTKDEKLGSSLNTLTAQSPEVPRSKSPMRQSVEVTTTKTVISRYPAVTRAESPRQREHPESPRQRTESPRQRSESDKPDKVPGYLRPTKTSQIKEESKVIEETEMSSRRGSGKFGVELRRTSVERSTISSERRHSIEYHQPCIEDIFDLDLLEQMLEKVVGYEQRRRIRAQIRIAKNQSEHVVDINVHTKTTKQTTSAPKTRSPDRKAAFSPDRVPKSAPQKTASPDRHSKSTLYMTMPDRFHPKEPTINGHAKEPARTVTRQRPHSPEKPAQKQTLATRTPVRQPSPDKRRTVSPTKVAPKSKGNRFNEYATAYMKKIGLNESDKVKFAETKTKNITEARQKVKYERQQESAQEFSTTKSLTERTSSKDVIEIVQTNGRGSISPEQRQSLERKLQFPERQAHSPDRKAQSPVRKAQSPVHKAQSPVRKAESSERKVQSPEGRAYSPERKAQSPERLHQRTPTPDFKRPKPDTVKETTIKTVYEIEKKIPSKPTQEEKPSWVMNRNLKKTTSETRTYSSKKIDNEKQKYRAPSPSKVISKPTDVITSSYGLGPLDADGKPLFGIKALRNGASNFQVKGTVIRQEFHSRNGGEPEGSVSVTAYSSQPEELQLLLAAQGGEPPSRLHGLSAITTTKKFGGDTGHTLSNVHTKEDRASLEQFTHHNRRVEHLENRTHHTGSQEVLEDTRRKEITGSTRSEDFSGSRRIESRKDDRQTDRNERSTRREDRVTEVKKGHKLEERRDKVEKREDKKTVRQSSVKSLTEKYIKSANDSGKPDRSCYPKAGLILRTTTVRDSVSSDEGRPGLIRTDSENSLGSVDDTVVTTTTERCGDGSRTTTTRTTHHRGPAVTTHTHGATVITQHEPVITTKKTSTVITQEPVITRRVITQEPVITHTVITQEPVVKVTQARLGSTVTTERSFLDSSTKVTGVQDILTRMKNADIVIQEGDTSEDSEARALLNKFLGATVLMAGMQGFVAEQPTGKLHINQETVRSSSSGAKATSRTVEELDLDQCWDERLLKKLLDECTDYDQRRRLRARIRTLMAEQEACASAVTEALGAGGTGAAGDDAREEEEVTVTSSVRRDSSDKTVSSSTTTKTSKVLEMTRPAPKPVSPFTKFRQLEKQNSTNSPNSPKTPQSPGSPSQPYFKFTDPALQASALTIKERLLQWCRDKTRDYENVKLENFSTSWADGLAFCALVHHFLPDAFDYSKLTADKRRHNFTLAFKVADEKAGIYPLLDVDDMVSMRKPDWKCVFTYVQAIYRRFKDEQ